MLAQARSGRTGLATRPSPRLAMPACPAIHRRTHPWRVKFGHEVPGTSALFLMVDSGMSGMALDPAHTFGGALVRTSLSQQGGEETQQARHGQPQGAA